MAQTALITGASSGIGKELAQIHAERGGDLILVARREDKLLELQSQLESEHSTRVRLFPMDLTEPSAPGTLFQALQTESIGVDFLINNAGFGGLGLFHERPWAQDLAMIQLNIVALTELCRLFLPVFLERGEGRILNVSSTASLPPGGPLQAVYFATKHYVTALSYGLAGELSGSPVTVTNLQPGATATEFASAAHMEDSALFSQAASARSVAQDGYQGLLAGKLAVVTGLTTSQKFLMTAMPFLPKKFVLQQIKKMQELPS
ncbi:MAG: SDR family oxidoreductase [Verrucomicrobiota bacterium]